MNFIDGLILIEVTLLLILFVEVMILFRIPNEKSKN